MHRLVKTTKPVLQTETGIFMTTTNTTAVLLPNSTPYLKSTLLSYIIAGEKNQLSLNSKSTTKSLESFYNANI